MLVAMRLVLFFYYVSNWCNRRRINLINHVYFILGFGWRFSASACGAAADLGTAQLRDQRRALFQEAAKHALQQLPLGGAKDGAAEQLARSVHGQAGGLRSERRHHFVQQVRV